VQAKIEKIGDGFGLLLPKELLDSCGFDREVTVTVEDRKLVVSPVPRRVREGWAEAARQMRARGDDLTPELQEWMDVPNEWDATEWQWPDTPTNEKV
jgi:antitoxin component of MazEF toxin-antitoxin module